MKIPHMKIPHIYLNDVTTTVFLFRLVEFIKERKLEEASKGNLFATSLHLLLFNLVVHIYDQLK